MAVKKGFAAVTEAIEKSGQGQGGSAVNIFGWDGEKRPQENRKILRFLDDEPLVVRFYSFILCKDGNKRDFPHTEDLPENPRPDWIGANIKVKDDKSGEMKAPYPSNSSVGWAVEREEERVGRGQFVFTDMVHDVIVEDEDLLEKAIALIKEKGFDNEVEGNVIKNVPVVGLVKQALRNFWEPVTAYYSRYGTITDRDYEISRSGKSLQTKYTIVPTDPDPDLTEQEQVDDRYELAKLLHPTPTEWIERMGSEDRFKYHLMSSEGDGDVSQEKGESKAPSTGRGGSVNSLKDELDSFRAGK